MTLPRFTAGAVGRLTFRDLNEAFEAIDQLRKATDQKLEEQLARRRIVLAKITGSSTGRYSWVEIEKTAGTTFQDRDKGRSSTEGSDPFANPVVPLGGVTLSTNDRLAIASAYDSTGKLYYVPLALAGGGGGGGGGIPARVLDFQEESPQKWRYTLREVYQSTPGIWFDVTNEPDFIAYNGAENTVDGPIPGTIFSSYGVGSEVQDGVAVPPERRPIRLNTVVMVGTDRNGGKFFSMPNGYRIRCQT